MDAKEQRDAHQAEKQGLLSALRDASAKGKRAKGAAKDDAAADIDALKNQLREHGRKLQPLPPQPTPRIENGTKEGVENVLRSAWPSVAWASSEGANVTGGHGFKDDALLRTLAFLNSRWDGAPIDRARSAEDYSRIYGRRVSVSLMLQPAAFEAFIRAGAGLARGIGNLARTLLVWPRSTMGTRFRDEDGADPELPALAAFLERAEELYRTPLPMPFDMECMEFGTDENGAPAPDQLELAPLELALSAEARRLWIRYQNDCEAQLPAEGELADVRDVAAKSAENACRLAALFHVWEHGPTGAINSMDMERGVAVARWFLYEARRILCGSADHDGGRGCYELLARWVESRPEPPTLQDVLQARPLPPAQEGGPRRGDRAPHRAALAPAGEAQRQDGTGAQPPAELGGLTMRPIKRLKSATSATPATSAPKSSNSAGLQVAATLQPACYPASGFHRLHQLDPDDSRQVANTLLPADPSNSAPSAAQVAEVAEVAASGALVLPEEPCAACGGGNFVQPPSEGWRCAACEPVRTAAGA